MSFRIKERSRDKKRKKQSLPVLFAIDVLYRPKRSNDNQSDDGSMVGSLLHSFPPLWPLTLDPDWTTAPLLWRRPLLSWMPGHKSSPGGVSRCWVAVVSRRLGFGSGSDWDLHYQQSRGVRIMDKERYQMKKIFVQS